MNTDARNSNTLIIILVLAAYTMIVLKNAWVCDDAYISFRTVDNFVNGYGLTWNVFERVQVFTHPLWVILLSGIYWFTGEIFFTVIVISVLLCLAALALYAFKCAGSASAACLGLLVLMLSDAFVDYSTSGLENPLTFLILAAFVYLYFQKDINIRTFAGLCMLAGLGAVNRLDTMVLFLPMLSFAFWKVRGWRAISAGLIGFIPLIMWELFALFYYGFLFPNTSNAKLGTGIDNTILHSQAFSYILNSIYIDPLTVAAIAAAMIIPFVLRDRRGIPAAIALILHVGYIFVIGGCFMSGRLLAAPLLLAVCLFGRYGKSINPALVKMAAVAILLLGLTTPYSPLFSDRDESWENFKLSKVATDERVFYAPTNGLMNYGRTRGAWPSHRWAYQGRAAKNRGDRLIVSGTVGMTGYFAGPQVSVLDYHALTDPLLARLPVSFKVYYKVGHYRRIVPAGYPATLETGENRIVDPSLAAYYDKLSILTRDPIFSWRRLSEIVKFNLGRYNHLVKAYETPHLVHVTLADISVPKKEGRHWLDAGNVIFDSAGIIIDLGTVHHTQNLEISRDHNDDLQAIYLLGDAEIDRQAIPAKIIETGGLSVSILDIPATAVERGYDKIRLMPEAGDRRYSIGHIRLFDHTPD